MKKNEAEIKFEQYRKHLREETLKLSIYIQLYKHLHHREQDRLDEMNIAHCFFKTVFSSLFISIVQWIHNLLDPAAKRGFFNFLTFIKHNIKIFTVSSLQNRRNYPDRHWMLNRDPITFHTIEADLNKIKKIKSLSSIKTRRDKFYAHFDKKYAFEKKKISSDAPIKNTDLDEIILVMKDILNKYSAAYDGGVYDFEPFNIYDVDDLLDALHKYNQCNKC
jgi:hypothetical protein